MTTAGFTYLNEGCIFECRGHSGFAVKGRDIVCAGISSLCLALYVRMMRLADENVVRIEYSHIGDGEMYMEIKYSDEGICRIIANEVLETAKTGFEKIAEMYPDNFLLE